MRQLVARQRLVQVRLAFGLVAGLDQALGFRLVAGFETGLFACDFVFEVKHAPRALDQTDLLFPCITHGCECTTTGSDRISGHWTSVGRAVNEHWTGCQTGEDSSETRPADPNQTRINTGDLIGGEGRNRAAPLAELADGSRGSARRASGTPAYFLNSAARRGG